MSYWTKVKGIIEVAGVGRTQPEVEYILRTIVEHLPRVKGSEKDMSVHLVKKYGHNLYQGFDEFDQPIEDSGKYYEERRNEIQTDYLIVVDGNMRDKYFEETYRAFVHWLQVLAKRTMIYECVVEVSGYSESDDLYKKVIINPNTEILREMFECPSWSRTREDMGVAWWEYLMWDRPRGKDGKLYEGKPDFPNGRWLEDMTKEEKEKIWETRGRRRNGQEV